MHPYSQKPAQNFWRKFVSDTPWQSLDFVGTPRFRLDPGAKVVTAGSCFAQHITRHMQKHGMTPYQAESPHPWQISVGADTSSYDAFSARYGNIYTSRQCLELFQQAFGLRPMVEDFAHDAGRVYDLLRPNAIPGGFASVEEARADRIFHLQKVREMFTTADVFVFTLGLTESWYHATQGHTYPVCPGTAKGSYDAQLHQFRNLTHADVVADMRSLIAAVLEVNPAMQFIFTVSPVPLVATQTTENVLVASSYSKSVLRAACGEVCDNTPQAQYFPSYEIINHPASFGQYLQGDLREVTERGVSHVMRSFFNTFYATAQAPAPTEPQATTKAAPVPDAYAAIQQQVQAECEEMFNDVGRTSP
jgi:hypothetical protein